MGVARCSFGMGVTSRARRLNSRQNATSETLPQRKQQGADDCIEGEGESERQFRESLKTHGRDSEELHTEANAKPTILLIRLSSRDSNTNA